MSFRDYENNEQSLRGGCDCNGNNRGLEYFHGLVMKAIHEFEEADQLGDKAAEYVAKAICLQEKANKEREDGREYLRKAFEWLERYGRNYDCNYANPACQRLLQQLQCLGEKQDKLDAYGLHEIKEGLAAWQKAEELGKKQQCVIEKYLQCIHAKRDCECHDDCLWD